jgi:hypothetical protein
LAQQLLTMAEKDFGTDAVHQHHDDVSDSGKARIT